MNPEPIKILLVAKSRSDVSLFQEMLLAARPQFELTYAVSLEIAFAQLAKAPVSVVLLQLPLLDAQHLEAIKKLCDTHPQLPIVVIGDIKNDKLGLPAIQIGAQDYLNREQIDAPLLVKSVLSAIERQKRQNIQQSKLISPKQGQQAEVAPTKQDQLLASVAIATNYLLTTNDFAAAVTFALCTLGNACNVERVYIFKNHVHPHTGELLASRQFAWTTSHSPELKDKLKLQHLSYKACFPRWQENLAAGKPVCGLVTDFPQIERENLQLWDTLSILIVPILIEGEFWGFLGFHDCHCERQWTETEQAIMTAAAGSIGGAIVRKQTEEALRESEGRFRAIFEYSGIGIGLANLDGRLIDHNCALAKMLGYSREEMQHMSFVDYTYQNDVAADSELFQELLDEKRDHYEIEKRYIHKDGRLLWGRLIVSLVRDSVGKPQFAIGMIEDITEQKQAEMYLRDSKEAAEAGSRAKSEFLATMSHELRTPLNAILGLSQLLQQEFVGALNAKQHEYLNCIYSSGEHLLALINDILDLSKIEVGKEELMCTPLAVQELCDYCLAVVIDRAQEKGLELVSQIAPQANICIADDRRAKQMLLNLLSNAIKFTPAGKVLLDVQKVPAGITFSVIDTGIGIALEQLEMIFQPFKQLDSQLNRQYEGTGLGLALTRKLARLHGGDVTVQSTLGAGSQFTLFLPDVPLQESEVVGAGFTNEFVGQQGRGGFSKYGFGIIDSWNQPNSVKLPAQKSEDIPEEFSS